MAVYTISEDNGEEYRCEKTIIGGDFDKVLPTGIEFDPVAKAVLMPDKTILHQRSTYQGVPVDMSHCPPKVRWGGAKRELTDLQKTRSRFLVSDKFRQVVEVLEPGLHQFQPVELIWDDDSHAADFFWFHPCARVDGMDRDHTTHPWNEKTNRWKHVDGAKFVANLAQSAGHHVWIDPRTAFGSVFVSETFKQAIESAGVKGVGFAEFETI